MKLILLLTIISFSSFNEAAETVKLRDGHLMPIIGFGTFQITGNNVYRAVRDAIQAGYRHIDTATLYGNEKDIGRAIKDEIASGKVKREDLFIVTKVPHSSHSYNRATSSVDKSLSNLGLKYIDLVLIHWPVGFKEGDNMWPTDSKGHVITSNIDYLETWKALEKAVENKKVRSIGVSNFNSQQITRVISNSVVKPSVNQIESHPYLIQTKLIEFCRKNQVAVTAFAPLGSGNVLKEKVISDIGKKHNKTAAQVLIRYQIQRNVIVIPKSSHKTRIVENFNVFNFNLTTDDISKIESLNRNKRFFDIPQIRNHKYYPYNIPF